MIIRNAKIEDAEELLRWRNDRITRENSKNNTLVDKNSHIKWINNILKDKSRVLYIGEENKVRIGVVRFDCNMEKLMAETSINLNPAMRGKNLSVSLLNLTIKKFLKKHTFTLNASIKKTMDR